MRHVRRTLARSTRQEAGLEVTKKAEYFPADKVHKRAAAGETVKYDIVAINTGNVDMTGTAIADTLFDLSKGTSQLLWAVREPSNRIAPFLFHEKTARQQGKGGTHIFHVSFSLLSWWFSVHLVNIPLNTTTLDVNIIPVCNLNSQSSVHYFTGQGDIWLAVSPESA